MHVPAVCGLDRIIQMNKTIVAGAGIAVLSAVGYFAFAQQEPAQPEMGDAIVEIVMPDALSPRAELGKLSFDRVCAACHGDNAVGKLGIAPPLVHIIYEPNHHGDESFQRAVAMGVPAHHWRFGNMPAIPDMDRGEVALITEYVRALQRANGIE